MATDTLPVEVIFGIYLGLLTGIVPALASWALGFIFKYVTDVSIPGFGVVVLALAIAGVNGGLLALTDPTIREQASAPVVMVAIVVVLMLSFYAHNRGDAMGAAVPHRLTLRRLRKRTLSADVVDLVGGYGRVRVTVPGEVADMEGYPPLSEELRAEIRGSEFTFPVDLRLRELETRLADRLETTYDLGDADVTIDERGRATVVAAPPFSGLSKRITEGRHAASVDGLVPTGLARGDEVTAITADAQVRGTVVSATTGDGSAPKAAMAPDETDAEDGGEDLPTPVRAPTTEGGEGRLTVAVTRTDVQPLLRADRPQIVVESRGTRREFEVVSLLRRADRRFRRVTIGGESPLAGQTLGSAAIRRTHDVAVLAIHGRDGWVVAPRGDARMEAGDELLVAGRRPALDDFLEGVA